MRVLVACEFSGVVREAFNAYSGVYAMSCDFLPPEDGRVDYHYQGDVRDVINDGWDLMIAHPPCDFLCSSGMHWTTRGLRDKQLTKDALEFVRFLMDAPIEKIAIENPIGVISTQIRKPDQIIQPYQFGHDASKSTCLWLRNLPPLQTLPKDDWYPPRIVDGKKRWGNQTNSGRNRIAPSPTRWAERSRTYTNIAQAMAEQWTK